MTDYNSYTVRVTPSMLSAGGVLRPDSLLELSTTAADMDMCSAGRGVSRMLEDGLAWVITSMYVKISEPIKECKDYTAKTKPLCRRGAFICREVILCSGEKEHSRTLITTALFDTRKRSIVYDVPPEYADEKLGRDGFPPKIRITGELEHFGERGINNSELDCIGHVNNGRYAAFTYDMFGNDKLSKMEKLSEFQILYKHELRRESILKLEKSEDENRFIARGTVNGDVSFESIFIFS